MTKPSQLELIVYELRVNFDELTRQLMAAYAEESGFMPCIKEQFIENRRVAYIDSSRKLEDPKALFLVEMLKKVNATREESIAYYAKTSIPPADAAIVQEFFPEDCKLVTTIQLKSIALQHNRPLGV